MFLSLLTDVYVIFSVPKHIDEVDALHLHLSLTNYLCGKYVYNFNTAFDYWLMLTIFHVQNVLIILDWCLCDFLCTETYWWSGCTSSSFVIYCLWSFTDVDYFSCAKLTDVYVIFLYWNILMKWMHLIFICYLLMLICCITTFNNILIFTVFHLQNVLIIVHWCLCDFLCTKTYQ